MRHTQFDLERAQRYVDDGERRVTKQCEMLAELWRLGFPMEEAEETLASAMYLLDQMRQHRDEIARNVKPDHEKGPWCG